MNNLKKFGFCAIGMLTLALCSSPEIKADLAAEYRRNGECYLLVGEGNDSIKGIWRLNNPEPSTPIYYSPAKQVISNIKETFSFDVDVFRQIYTFTQHKEFGWILDTDPLKRQVLDSVSAKQSDYGYHEYIHDDHRDWNRGSAVYRVGPVGRAIKGRNGDWAGFRSAGPGTPIPTPSYNPLPNMSDSNLKLGVYSGRSWYSIPNGSFYSTWLEKKTEKGFLWIKPDFSKFYTVMGDKNTARIHKYNLNTWTAPDINIDRPVYRNKEGAVVAETKELKIQRQVLAGCLDGCGGASGSGSADAAKVINDIAFQPPLKGNPERTYFYKRTDGTSEYTIEKNKVKYNPDSSNPLIGRPGNTDTEWLCISLRDKNTDYVYCLGNSVIRDWYYQVYGQRPEMNITAVTVSNQWNQKGGIVYAYDKANKKIYKFERRETEAAPLTRERFLALDVSDITKQIKADEKSEIDDIKADGFGSLYFALTHPSLRVSTYDPRDSFKPNDCIHIHHIRDYSDGKSDCRLVYKQEYGKKVFERNYTTGKITKIGDVTFAARYYCVTAKLPTTGYRQLAALPLPNSNVESILASWSATLSGLASYPGSNWPKYVYSNTSLPCDCKGADGKPLFREYNLGSPGLCRLGVINAPTPPKVISLGGKKSYLDICGPYEGMIPVYDKINRSTNQSDGLMRDVTALKVDRLYFYMVENYTLEDGAQDPTLQPDWDDDHRWGGFITSVRNPAPYSNTPRGGMKYEWKTWMVKDLYDHNVCKVATQVTAEEGKHYNYFYSPVYGKFIITCRVIYDWYDYDKLPFGSTIEDLDSVLYKDEKAWPVARTSGIPVVNGLTMEKAEDRLAAIKNLPAFSFMKGAKDDKGNDIDYSKIVADGPYWAMEPIVCGNGAEAVPETNYETARISRCDDIPGYGKKPDGTWRSDAYVYDNRYYSNVPSDTGCYGIESGMAYHWRIDIASQTNIFKDISKVNGTNKNAADYNYVAHQMITPGTPFYVNSKANFKFLNGVGDVRWSDNKIDVLAYLEYKVPGRSKPIKKFLIQGSGTEGEAKEIIVNAENAVFSNNKPIIATTEGDLPPTDPTSAELVIEMRRKYEYDMWAYYNGKPSFCVNNLPGWLKIRGKAAVKIVDTAKPKFEWEKTNPNNLFGKTGRPIQSNDGPSGKTNPTYLEFTITDQNPWEGVENQNYGEGVTELTLSQHIINYAKNFGYEACCNYCRGNSPDDPNDRLQQTFRGLKSAIMGDSDAQGAGIKQRIADNKAKKQPTSDMNLKALFTRAARDVRFEFDTATRNGNASSEDYGKIKVGRASAQVGQDFGIESSKYAVNYVSGDKHQERLILASSETSKTIGGTTKHEATLGYKVAVNNIRLGANDSNMIPEGYANNTPGYRPYTFYVSATDSSGNSTGFVPLNTALHVIDDIPPVAYGSVLDKKDNKTSTFPYKTLESEGNYGKKECTPVFSVNSNGEYFGSALADDVKRNTTWSPANNANGYIEDSAALGYQALKSLGDDISNNVTDDIFKAQVTNGLSPKPTEDNVECVFKVYVSDNAGCATATMNIKYYSKSGDNVVATDIKEAVVSSGFESSALADKKVATYTVGVGDKSFTTLVFRGGPDQLPMGIPITITAEDNAMNWDYYNPADFTYDNIIGSYSWPIINKGSRNGNIRTFKTTLPVFDSVLDIRTLEKTIRNE